MGFFDGLPSMFVDTFGQTVEVRSETGGIVQINAIVRTEDDDQTLFEGGTVRGSRVLHARSEDVQHMKEGDQIFLGSDIYKAGALIRDRHGMTRIPMHTN